PGELALKRAAVEVLSVGIEHHHGRILRNDVGERDRFFDHALGGIAGAALPDFDDFDVTQAELPAGLRGTLAVACTQFGFRALLQTPDSGNDDAHRTARFSACSPRVPARRRPHLFQIVEGADLGPEDMHDNVSGIDEDPVSLPHSLDADAGPAASLDVLHEVVGHGAHVTLRSAARHDHVIAYGGFAGEIDDNAVLGLHVFQTREDGFEHLLGSRMPGDGFGLTTLRPRECRCAQGFWSFRYVAPAPVLAGVHIKIITSSVSFYPGGAWTSLPILAWSLCFPPFFSLCFGSLFAL